jgi:osmoprotectant transport system permease protein
MSGELAELPDLLAAHLQLALAALALAIAGSVPLGVLATRRPRLEGWLLGAAGVAQTVPSLALLAIMVPALAVLGALLEAGCGVGLRSIGFLPALLALTLYGTLPILRNTVAGVRGVDPAVIEAARGVGMTEGQQLWRVELPLALPVIVAGVRTSAVWVVGTATLSTPVGAPSLGNLIFSGLQTRNPRAVWLGCAASAFLALALDQLIRLLEIALRRRRRSAGLAAGVGLLALGAFAAGAFAHAWLEPGARPLLVGAKTFTEQYVLAAILERTLERGAGQRARAVPSLGSTVLFDALRAGEIDVYVDYSGTVWATLMRRTGRPPPRERLLAEVEQFLARRHGVTLLAALGFENRYALALREERARELGVARIGELARVAPSLEIGGDYEFFARAEWRALEAAYGLRFRARRNMDPSLLYAAVASGEVDVISAFSSDGRIEAFGLRLLDDERGVIPAYDAIVLAGAPLLREAPRAAAALRALAGSIDAAAMRRMNLAVDRDGRSPAEVAEAFLASRAGPP